MGAEHLKAVRRAARRRTAANAEFRAAVIAASREGHESLRAIAAEAGLSHVAVLKIVRGAEGA